MKSALAYSQKMKQYRFEHQLKQEDIAKKLGISQQVYSLIESGNQKPKIDFVLLYRKITGIDLTDDLEKKGDGGVPTISLKELSELTDIFDQDKGVLHTIRTLRQEIKTLQKKWHY